MHRPIRHLPALLLLIHILWSLSGDELLQARDLYLYNFIWLSALIAIMVAPLHLNRVGITCLALAISSWGAGSLIASIGQFFSLDDHFLALSDYLYLAFYPLLLIALIYLSKGPQRTQQIETLDALIFAIGVASVLIVLIHILLFREIRNETIDYFNVIYPLADVALTVVAIIFIINSGADALSSLLTLAIAIFGASDFYFIWLAFQEEYQFGNIADSGWLLSIYLFSVAVYQRAPERSTTKPLPPFLVALSVFITPILSTISVLRPDLIPIYLLIPSLANLLIALIRMNTALLHSRTLHDERILARTDELTGLPNRRRLIHELNTSSKFEGALLLMDLNEFKPLNDQYGHDFGDLVLREVSRRFARALPQGALLARLGGDEFGVMVPGSNDQTLECARALHASLSYPLSISGREIKVGVSIGHVFNDGRGELLKRADLAMYRAKQMDMGVAQS